MLTMIANLKDAARRRARYVHMRDQLASLTEAEAYDIGISPLNAASIAHEAVYGRA